MTGLRVHQSVPQDIMVSYEGGVVSDGARYHPVGCEMRRSRRPAALLILGAMVTAGLACTDAAEPDARGDGAAELPHPELLTVDPTDFVWTQGWKPTDMGVARGRVCLLTRITGDFEGGGEFVEIVPSGGHWWLQGDSFQQGIGAHARCLQVSWYSGEYAVDVNEGQAWANLAANPAVCGLTRVAGLFDGSGPWPSGLSIDEVEIQLTASGSQLFVNAANEYLGARSRCFTPAKIVAQSLWDAGVPVTMHIYADPAFCFLTAVGGDFEGGGEYVEVYQAGGWWWLGGGTLQDELFARARCVT